MINIKDEIRDDIIDAIFEVFEHYDVEINDYQMFRIKKDLETQMLDYINELEEELKEV